MGDNAFRHFLNFTFFVFLMAICSPRVFSQSENPEISDNVQTIRKAETLREMDEGVILMETGDYAMADEKFRYALKNLDVVPSKLVFYIGKNSYYLQQYKQSIDWLNKYIELKGTKGQFYFESVSFLKEAEQKYLLETSKSNIDSTSVALPDSTLKTAENDCSGNEKFICPVCKGKTVIVEEGKLGKKYKSCPFSDDHGYLTCEEYYLLIQGKLKPKF